MLGGGEMIAVKNPLLVTCHFVLRKPTTLAPQLDDLPIRMPHQFRTVWDSSRCGFSGTAVLETRSWSRIFSNAALTLAAFHRTTEAIR